MYPPHPDEYNVDMLNFIYNDDDIRADLVQQKYHLDMLRTNESSKEIFSDYDLTGTFINIPSPLSYRYMSRSFISNSLSIVHYRYSY